VARRFPTRLTGRLLGVLLLFATFATIGCAQCESMRWAQMSPALERSAHPNDVSLGVRSDEPVDVIDARLR